MTKTDLEQEKRRLAIQTELDAAKNQAERNKLGQFATPTELARQILEYAKTRLGNNRPVHFIDPAIGTGSFFSALLNVFPEGSVKRAAGYEVDPHYGSPAKKLWRETSLDIRIHDFTSAAPPPDGEKFNLLVCNPPYVRHHHINASQKQRLKAQVKQITGIEMNGLAGLYCYFLGLSHRWMAEGGLAGWLIPSEFMDVNYGTAVKRYLLECVTLLHIHRFDPNEVQFGDALVSSSVVWFTKDEPSHNHKVRMSYGGSLQNPKLERLVPADILRRDRKWTHHPMKDDFTELTTPKLSDYFIIKRGLVTGHNKYFILPIEEIEKRNLPIEAFRPILPSPRYLPGTRVLADRSGNPVLERQLFLLDCKLPESEVKERLPNLGTYLEEGKAQGIADRYLCRHRKPWYAQENRPAAPFLCTYLGRITNKNRHPFRFILNESKATAPNVYLMLYPKPSVERAIVGAPELKHQIWEFLNRIDANDVVNQGRVYGGGLYKLEPKELGRVPATDLVAMLPKQSLQDNPIQPMLLEPVLV